MLFNPSLTGTSGSDVQIGFVHRNQWGAIRRQPYTTTAALAELRQNKIGLGFQVFNQKAGEASLKTTGVMFTGAFHKPLTEMSELSIGIALGRLQRSFNPALFTFENQYVPGEGFDASQATGETFARTKAGLTDVAVGLNWKGRLSSSGNVIGNGGLSLAHIHLPDQGLNELGNELPMRTTVTLAVDFQVQDRIDITPNLFYQRQGLHQALVCWVLVLEAT